MINLIININFLLFTFLILSYIHNKNIFLLKKETNRFIKLLNENEKMLIECVK